MTDSADQYGWRDRPTAHGGPVISGRIKSTPEDFKVFELCDHQPCGEGEHLWVWLRKTGANTEWAAQQLARAAGIRPRDIGYAGKKDRHAVTEQWFSLHLPGKRDPDFSVLPDNLEVLRAERHNRKLRRGAHSGNRFEIVIRDVEGDLDLLEQRLTKLREQGCPNYFGDQRFGIDGNNLIQAAKHRDSGSRKRPNEMWLSAVRALLFNKVLAERVRQGTWNKAIPGDCMMLDGSNSVFVVDEVTEDIERRVAEFDIHPSGPLWGSGESLVAGDALAIQKHALRSELDWIDWIKKLKAEVSQRSMRDRSLQFESSYSAGTLVLGFHLASGSFATTLLSELVGENDHSFAE